MHSRAIKIQIPSRLIIVARPARVLLFSGSSDIKPCRTTRFRSLTPWGRPDRAGAHSTQAPYRSKFIAISFEHHRGRRPDTRSRAGGSSKDVRIRGRSRLEPGGA